MKRFALLFIIVFLGSSAYSGSLDSKGEEASLRKTQQMLMDVTARQKFLYKDKDANTVDESAKNIVNNDPKKLEELYSISSSVFEVIAKKAGGDSHKMQELMAQFQKSPEAFLSSMTPEQRQRIKALARKISSVPKKN